MNEFIKRMKNSKALSVLLSILIACIMWVYVVNTENPDIDDTIHDVPVVMEGTDVLEERGLILTGLSLKDMDLRLTGKRDGLFPLNETNITVTADVSSIQTAGSYTLRCTVSLPSGSTVVVNNRDMYRVTVTVEERVSRTVAVRGELSGSVAKGYQGGEMSVSPASVEITGPASLVERIEYARVNLTGSGLKETYTGLLPLELIDEDGTVVTSGLIERANEMAYVHYPISMVKELELTVSLKDGGGATAENTAYTIEPSSVTVSGPEWKLSGLEEISLGEIDLVSVSDGSVVLLAINLPFGLTQEDGEKEVQIKVHFEGLVTKLLNVTEFELTGIPEGWSAQVDTTTLAVTVRGTEEAVAAVHAGQIRAVADLSSLTPESGEMEVPVRLSLTDASESAGVAGNYSIRVQLSRL